MSFDAFMKVDGVEGESLDDGHKGWVELLSYHYNAMQSISQTASSNGELLLEGFPLAISRSANMWIEPPRSYLSFAVGVRISKM